MFNQSYYNTEINGYNNMDLSDNHTKFVPVLNK